jgi:hypothetical protein
MEQKVFNEFSTEGMLLEGTVEVALVTFALRVEIIRLRSGGITSMMFLRIKG